MNRCIAPVFIVCLFACALVDASPVINQTQFKMKAGDDLRWAQPEWNDKEWSTIQLQSLARPEGIVWLRAEITLSAEFSASTNPLGLAFSAMASHEIYWDGVLIGRGGTPAVIAAQEKPGPIQAHYLIADRLSQPGTHLIAIRTSAFHRHFAPATGYWFCLIGDYDNLSAFGRQTTYFSLMSLSGMIVVAIFAFLLYLIDRSDRSYLLLSLIGLVGAHLLITEAWRNLFGYTYNWHFLRLVLITAFTAVLNFIFLLFAVTRFPSKGRRWFLLAGLCGFAGSMTAPGWDNKALSMFVIGITLSFIWTFYASLQKRRGAWLATAGFAGTGFMLFWKPDLFSDLNLYFGIDFLLLCLLSAHIAQIRQVHAEREEAFLRSTRLEIELLKKYIQPHYLMNTLTALTEWIEREPAEAARMVEHLSEEFRLMSAVANRSSISLQEEIRLCRSHLEIMSRRKGRVFVLCTTVDDSSVVPPAIFHTLVENAVIHNKHTTQKVEFSLTEQKEDQFTHYIFDAPMGANPEPAEAREGTGLRYIRARLQENYGDRWKLFFGPQRGHWRTELWLPRGN